ncbi:hypothetical protein CMT41_17925 [Colwellia sp. MT41]|uniref:NACHT domain-containing protein n=1 Tax=Colwellia sp. MT41 TaxID=58049 RepID=UPI000717A04A|nr:NACHT domain-containing protein [Colwellia sp. MT41]ALO36411.1 hypothetical protein CMT41_17925 [Colwellia sp. MT41]
MSSLLINELLKQKESEWLEFKSYWYWKAADKITPKAIGEFLKDFTALFNTYVDKGTKKYFIIGFDEKTKECNNYNEDRNGKVIPFFTGLDDFKVYIAKKIKLNFKAIPNEVKNSLEDIQDFFKLEEINFQGKKLLVIQFNQAPFCLELTKELQGNASFKIGNLLIRKNKVDGEPENGIANHEDSVKLIEQVKLIKKNDFPDKIISIDKLVRSFVNKTMPLAQITCSANKEFKYELFKLVDEYIGSLSILYFNKNTSQDKTIAHLVTEQHITPNDKVILITDNANKSGGKFNLHRIINIFKEKKITISAYTVEDFSYDKIYREPLDSDIFHDGSFAINDFISPMTTSSDEKHADTLLYEWFEEEEAPLLVIKGLGGIGKTTVAKDFLDKLYKDTSGTAKILFISSHDLINEMMRQDRIEDIFDFYRVLAEKENVSKQLNKEQFELSIDHGNLIFVIDGIDEVISKLGEKFDVSSLISAIFNVYSDSVSNTKVLFTCRDEFWERSQIDFDIKTLTLKPFTEKLALEYFKFQFGNDDKKTSKAMGYANTFALNEKSKEYIPYILDMVKENLLSTNLNQHFPSSKILIKSIPNDFLIGKVCEREIVKLDQTSIEDQVDIFTSIATHYEGNIHKSHLNKLLNDQSSDHDIEKSISIYISHPLLIYSAESETLTFRYDFFTEYFKGIHLSKIFIKNILEDISENTKSIITEIINLDSYVVKIIKQRLSFFKISNEDIKNGVYMYINMLIEDDDCLKNRKVTSSLFSFLISLFNPHNIKERTSLLIDIFSSEDNVINNLCLINFHTKRDQKPTFDFSGYKLDNCWLENYDCFGTSRFNDITYFSNSTFIAPLFTKGIKTLLNRSNFEQKSCELVGIENKLVEIEVQNQSQQEQQRTNVIRCLKLFWSNGRFKEKLLVNINKKMKNHSHVLGMLIKIGVLEVSRSSTSTQVYNVSNKFSNLRKVMEENNDCVEFENIMTQVLFSIDE